MKKISKLMAMFLMVITMLSLPVQARAASDEDGESVEKTASLSIYKYDLTAAEKDGAWTDSSYVSSGIYDQRIIDGMSNYAVPGVVFTAVKIGSTELRDLGSHSIASVYSITDDEFIRAIGLSHDKALVSGDDADCYSPETVHRALASALNTDATGLKNSLENHVKARGLTMPATDEYGHTKLEDLALGLYLVVETKVPENVTCTCNPFIVSLPMTAADGSGLNYDVTVYPKNETGIPTLEKTVRESKTCGGDNRGSTDDTADGYGKTAAVSGGDILEYQILSTLPTITSEASYLSKYIFTDALSKGLAYVKNDVHIGIFSDKACKTPVASWDESSGFFTVSYSESENVTMMTVSLTGEGLKEINSGSKVYSPGSTERGCSGCVMRITYSCKAVPGSSLVCGDKGNPNTISLTWSRSNPDSAGTLEDDAHVYSYAVEITKKFSEGAGKMDKVSFNIQDRSSGQYVLADRASDGIYYVKGYVSEAAQAAVFVPDSKGKILIRGLEDSSYTANELSTDREYNLLKSGIKFSISTSEASPCPTCHKPLLTAAAEVNGTAAEMRDDGGSVHAIVPFTVVNTKGFELPKTGSYGTWMFTVGGVLLLGASAFLVWKLIRKKESR